MLTTAIKEGWSEGKFVKNASEMFEKKGWTGKKEVTNPKTGEVETVELGTSRRIKTIFRCNMSSAYSVGRYKQQLEDADVAPYFQYCSVMDGRTRPAHQAMNGKAFRYDDPIWNTMYPPNGWNCRCTVVSLTPGMVKRKGLTVESSEGRLTETTETVGDTEKPNTSYRFDRNGLVYDLKPDAGWGNNAGKASILDDILSEKIELMPKEVRKHFIAEIAERQKTSPKIVNDLFKKIIPIQKATEMNLDKKDLTVLFKYTHASKPYNSTILKKINGEKITERDIDRVNELSEIFKKVTPTNSNLTTYRGEGIEVLEQIPNFKDIKNLMINPKSEDEIKKVAKTLTGEEITQDLFMSTSFNKSKAAEYASNAKEPRILWIINTPTGTKAIDTRELSSKKYEEELLFDKGQKLNIEATKFNKKDNLWQLEASII